MENKQTPSKKKLLSIQEEKVNHPVDCDSNLYSGAAARKSNKQLLQDQNIPQEKPGKQKPSNRVLVNVRPRPAIKTIFLAEKSRFYPRKETVRSRSILAIGDHPSFTTQFGETRSSSASPSTGERRKKQIKGQRTYTKYLNIDNFLDNQLQVDSSPQKPNVYQTRPQPSEKCYAHTQLQTSYIDIHHKLKRILNTSTIFTKNVPHYIVANSSDNRNLSRLNKRINLLERKVRRQEMVLGAIDPCNSLSSSDEGSRENIMRIRSGTARPGCSCINNYSHIPETSAFQRYAQQSAPLSPNIGTTIEKEHNSEQYGRDFTTYDGITARGRRQCSSATNKRDDLPKQAAERVIKIRHKLNPVRDYRLMDTVHYLAQGEFAPRNDGIKLTPSREAVLSDIIWEDVCRTHWPSARLGRRHGQQERYNTRCELQRLIDSLLRERVAHVERRRRRHYRIVKLNHRQENSAGPIGKTGDIIVASHKHKHLNDDDDVTSYNASGAMITSRKWHENGFNRHRSHDRLTSPEMGKRRRVVQDECTPGPSYAVPRAPGRREPTCCYHAAGPSTQTDRTYKASRENFKEKISSSSTASSDKQRKNPRLVVRKDPSRKKHHQKEELNLEHFILLPTLVVRTPSNVKRQKKFNELYHRILNQLGTDENDTTKNDEECPRSHRNCKKDSVTSMDRGKTK